MIERLLASAERHMGARPILRRVVERGHSRIVYVELASNGTPRRLVIKQVRVEGGDETARERALARVQAEYDVLRRIEGGFEPGQRFIRVPPVAILLDQVALVMEEAPGDPFNRYLQRNGMGWPPAAKIRHLEDLCHLSGAWLHGFQAFMLRAEDPGPHLGALETEIAETLGRLTERNRVKLPRALAQALQSFVGRAIREAPPGALEITGMTGEFCPANILVSGDRLAVLDFGLAGPGLALNDLVLFHHHLEMLRYDPRYRPGPVRRLQEAFLEGYGRPGITAEPLFDVFRVKFKLSRMDATSGRKWPSLGPAHRLWYPRVWDLQKQELHAILAAHE